MREKLLEQIDIELKRIYHNATIRGKLSTESDYENDLYESEFEFQSAIAFEDLCHDFLKMIKVFGKIYQYGRGGRTLCFSKMHRDGRYGCAIHSSDTLELDTWSDDDLEWIASELKRFNDEVISWCNSIQDHIIETIREDNAENIELNKNKKRVTRQVTTYE